ncbi:hypothetical protein [Yersinia enterocolitica]|uniref:hypothetical protein n=1 Tax=Yersinia enterocolitica TaxID=630 RepID=UPI003F45922A
MNNFEEYFRRLHRASLCTSQKCEVYASDLRSVLKSHSSLIAQLEASQKNLDEMTEQYVDRTSALTYSTLRAEKAEAELSAANEKLSKPVVLPDYRCSPDMHTKQYYETIGFNLGLDACKAVIKTAGFTVEGNADAE